MTTSRIIRLSVFLLLVGGACVWFHDTKRGSENVTLLVTFVVCLVTSVYSFLTFEILLENQTMAQATRESTALMEKSLRFPSSAHLSFCTVGTKNPRISELLVGVSPYRNDDYARAIEITEGGNSDADFVFAVIENKGPGTATKVTIDATYSIIDSGNANRKVNVEKGARVPILETGKGVAICIFISRLPTLDDGASLISATIANSDFYRDAIGETVQNLVINREDHQTERLTGSTLKLL